MSEKNFKIYSGKRCEEYYKKYNLVSAVHKIIDLEDIINEVREYIEDNIIGNYFKRYDDDIYIACEHILKILDKENK